MTIIWVPPSWCTTVETEYNAPYEESLELILFDKAGWPDDWNPVCAWGHNPIHLQDGTAELLDAAAHHGIRIPVYWFEEKPTTEQFYPCKPINQYNQIWPQ